MTHAGASQYSLCCLALVTSFSITNMPDFIYDWAFDIEFIEDSGAIPVNQHKI
jgi:hypothetical protein